MTDFNVPLDFVCFKCSTAYKGNPSQHICPDGTTFEQRTALKVAGREDPRREENEQADRNLTLSDRRLLRCLKVKW